MRKFIVLLVAVTFAVLTLEGCANYFISVPEPNSAGLPHKVTATASGWGAIDVPDVKPAGTPNKMTARELGDYDRAISELREAVRADKEATDAALLLARIYLEQGEYNKAITFANAHVTNRPESQKTAVRDSRHAVRRCDRRRPMPRSQPAEVRRPRRPYTRTRSGSGSLRLRCGSCRSRISFSDDDGVQVSWSQEQQIEGNINLLDKAC